MLLTALPAGESPAETPKSGTIFMVPLFLGRIP